MIAANRHLQTAQNGRIHDAGFYALFSGQTVEHVIVNFYDVSGNLIETADSTDIGS